MDINRSRINLGAEEVELDAEAKARLRQQLLRSEQSPTTRHQAFSYQYFQKLVGDLGNPYDLTRIPVSVLRQMERDPIIAFALYFIHVPIIRAKWHIECSDARVAAFVDNSLRRILASYIRQRKQAMNYGFVPIVKRFQLENPDWKYIDPAKSDDEIPVWDEGNVEAITWKPFINLPSDPTIVEPRWTAKGEFNGIKYQGGANLIPFNAIENKQEGSKDIPVSHSLWLTNEKEGASGSLWGFPRIGYSYRYWWSYWFHWALFDRFFERKADPPYVVYYPISREQDFAGTNSEDAQSMREIALGIAESARSGGAIAMPGDTVKGYEDRPTQLREWEIGELEVKGDMAHFVDSFKYLDVMKLRSLWISEFAVTEGQGGTSSRNTMGEQLNMHKEGAGALADEIDDEINRFVIPDIVNANFPNFKGTCKKITTSFAKADQETMQQALQWLGQNDVSALRQIDVRQLLERLGMPLVSHSEIRRQEEEAEKALRETMPDEIDPDTEKAGVNKQGFYVQPRETIKLNFADEFLSGLPTSKHYKDKSIRKLSSVLWNRWKKSYKDIYEDFAKYLAKQNFSELKFVDEDDLERIIENWNFPQKRLEQLLSESKETLEKVINRAANIELRDAGLPANFEPNEEDIAAWLDARGTEFVKAVDETVKDELRTFLSAAIREGAAEEELANAVREHFADWPDWKANRLVRSEIRNSYNYATLAAGEQAGIKIVQARDGQHGPTDEECEKRNGQFFTIPEAFNEVATEHPNGTLEFHFTNRENLSIERVISMPNESDALAYFDENTDTIYMTKDIPLEIEQSFLCQLGKAFER